MMDELRRLRELTEALTGNGYLKDQAKEWEYALDAIPECVYIINNKFEMKFVNKTLADRLGKNKEDLLNKICYKEIYGKSQDFPALGTADDHKVLKSKTLLEDVYIVALCGWFKITRSPIYTNNSKLLGFICVLQDITERKKSSEGLVHREATLDAIYNAAPIGIGLIEEGTRIILTVNKFLTDLTGYSEKELVGCSTRILFPTEDEFVRVGKINYAGVKSIGIGTVETQFLTKAGDILDVFLKTTEVKSRKQLVFTITDITDRKIKEKQLNLNEERLKSILELTKMSYKSYEEVTSFALEEAIRLTDSKIGYMHFVNNTDDGLDLNLFQWSKETTKDCVSQKVAHYPLSDAGCWADSIREKKPIIHNDYSSMTFEDGKKGLPQGHIQLNRHMGVPIMEDDTVVAVAGVGNKCLPYDETDLRQLNLFMNSMWDILKRQKAEGESKRNREYFERLISSTPTGIFVYKLIDDSLILKHFNKAATSILKIDYLILNKTIEELFYSLIKLPIIDEFKKIAREGGVFSDPVYRYMHDSKESFFSVTAFQSDIYEVAVLFYEVTEHIKAFDDIKNEQEKFKIVFDNSTDAITIIRLEDEIIIDINPAFERYTGYKKEDVIGYSMMNIELWRDVFNDSTFHDLLLKDSEVMNYPSVLKLKDGSIRNILVSSSIIYINQVPHVVSITRLYGKNSTT
jgi:PAS domain S-box-containing protein